MQKKMPKRIHLVRHGLSESNLSVEVNRRKPDHAICLAEEGHKQAVEAGKFLAEHIQSGVPGMHRRKVRLMVSPYLRTRQTADGLEEGIRRMGIAYDRHESLQLREQSFGLFDGIADDELAEIYPREHAHYEKHAQFEGVENGLKGEFFAPMPMGESRARVCDRVRGTFGSILRSLRDDYSDIVIVSHGVTIRCFIREFMHYPWKWCEKEPNPNNCSITTIEGERDKGWEVNRIFDGFEHPKDPGHAKQEHREEGHI